jgi:hypothetical protein
MGGGTGEGSSATPRGPSRCGQWCRHTWPGHQMSINHWRVLAIVYIGVCVHFWMINCALFQPSFAFIWLTSFHAIKLVFLATASNPTLNKMNVTVKHIGRASFAKMFDVHPCPYRMFALCFQLQFVTIVRRQWVLSENTLSIRTPQLMTRTNLPIHTPFWALFLYSRRTYQHVHIISYTGLC